MRWSLADPLPGAAAAAMAAACRRLRLPTRERTLVVEAFHARTALRNGRLLITPARVAAAERLALRGYLVEAANQPKPLDRRHFGVLVMMTDSHVHKLLADAAAQPVEEDR